MKTLRWKYCFCSILSAKANRVRRCGKFTHPGIVRIVALGLRFRVFYNTRLYLNFRSDHTRMTRRAEIRAADLDRIITERPSRTSFMPSVIAVTSPSPNPVSGHGSPHLCPIQMPAAPFLGWRVWPKTQARKGEAHLGHTIPIVEAMTGQNNRHHEVPFRTNATPQIAQTSLAVSKWFPLNRRS